VLGIVWLITLSDILWNFDKLTMEFNVQGRRHVLRGYMAPKIKPTPKQQLSKAFLEGVHLFMIHLGAEEEMLLHSLTTHTAQKEIPTEIANLFQEFADVFPEPQQLPPFSTRPCQGINPINKRLVKYPLFHS